MEKGDICGVVGQNDFALSKRRGSRTLNLKTSKKAKKMKG
jgi:hypothetical protein